MPPVPPETGLNQPSLPQIRRSLVFRTAKTPAQNADGFSLVEVALALGILAFGLISLIGLLPGSLTNFRSAIDRQVNDTITQSLEAKSDSFTYAELVDGGAMSGTFPFDSDGILTTTTDSVFTAKLEFDRSPLANVFSRASPPEMTTVKVVAGRAGLNSSETIGTFHVVNRGK